MPDATELVFLLAVAVTAFTGTALGVACGVWLGARLLLPTVKEIIKELP